jgi:hypothetical protein
MRSMELWEEEALNKMTDRLLDLNLLQISYRNVSKRWKANENRPL